MRTLLFVGVDATTSGAAAVSAASEPKVLPVPPV
jgi:hypothetical protein